MQINFLEYSECFFTDQHSLKSIRETLLNELENLPESDVKFEILSHSHKRSYHLIFQGRLVIPLVRSPALELLSEGVDTIFNLPSRIEKIWLMLQMFSCCKTFILEEINPFEFKKFSLIGNPFLVLAFKDDNSTLRQLPNDILRLISKIIIFCDLRNNARLLEEFYKRKGGPCLRMENLYITEKSENLNNDEECTLL